MVDFLYVVYSPMRKQVKIGRTFNPRSRLSQISKHIGDPDCEYIAMGVAYLALEDDNLSDIEERLHWLFCEHNQITHSRYGEWFDVRIVGDLLCLLREITVFFETLESGRFEAVSDLRKLRIVHHSSLYPVYGIETRSSEDIKAAELKAAIDAVKKAKQNLISTAGR